MRGCALLSLCLISSAFMVSAYGQCDFSPSDTLGPFPIGPIDIPLTPTGGTPPYTFDYAPGAPVIPGFRVSNAPAVPSGYTAAQTATLVGLPRNPNQSSMTSKTTTIRLTDNGGCTKDKTVTVLVTPVDLATSPDTFARFNGDSRFAMPGHGVGESPESFSGFLGVGGTGSYLFEVTSGNLPSGISLNASTGEVMGSFTAAGTFDFTLKVTDGAGNSYSRAFETSVSPLGITNVSGGYLPNGTVNVPYSFTFQATGGTGGPYTFSQANPPAGLTFSSSGVLSGTPTSTNFGSSPFRFLLSDGTNSRSVNLGLAILPAVPPPPSPSLSVFDYPVGVEVQNSVSWLGGAPPYTFDLAPGSAMPPGVFLTPGGFIRGRARQPGTYTFMPRITDSLGNQGAWSVTWKIVDMGLYNLSYGGSSQPPYAGGAVINQPTSNQTLAYGGTPPYAIASTNLPQGLTIDSTGLISGVPEENALPIFFNVQMSDSSPTPTTANLPMYMIIGTPPNNPSGLSMTDFDSVLRPGVLFTQTVQVTGGTPTPSYTLTIADGALPPGLTLLGPGQFNNGGSVNNAAQITGTSSAIGLYQPLVLVGDGAGTIGQRRWRFNVTTLSLVTTSLPVGTLGQPYSQTLVASAGVPPFTFSITSGTLPSGLSLNTSTGLISGTPTGPGGPVTFRVTDSTGCFISSSVTFTVNSDLGFLTTSLASGTVGQPYSQTLVATGSATPFTFTTTSALPAGLSLNSSTGVISGTPTGTFGSNIVFRVTSATGFYVDRNLLLTVATFGVSDSDILPLATTGRVYSYTFNPSVPGAYTWTIQGSAPAGLTLNASTGVLSGHAFGFRVLHFHSGGHRFWRLSAEELHSVLQHPAAERKSQRIADPVARRRLSWRQRQLGAQHRRRRATLHGVVGERFASARAGSGPDSKRPRPVVHRGRVDQRWQLQFPAAICRLLVVGGGTDAEHESHRAVVVRRVSRGGLPDSVQLPASGRCELRFVEPFIQCAAARPDAQFNGPVERDSHFYRWL